MILRTWSVGWFFVVFYYVFQHIYSRSNPGVKLPIGACPPTICVTYGVPVQTYQASLWHHSTSWSHHLWIVHVAAELGCARGYRHRLCSWMSTVWQCWLISLCLFGLPCFFFQCASSAWPCYGDGGSDMGLQMWIVCWWPPSSDNLVAMRSFRYWGYPLCVQMMHILSIRDEKVVVHHFGVDQGLLLSLRCLPQGRWCIFADGYLGRRRSSQVKLYRKNNFSVISS